MFKENGKRGITEQLRQLGQLRQLRNQRPRLRAVVLTMCLEVATRYRVEIGLQTEGEGKTRIQIAMESFQLAKVAANALRQTLRRRLVETGREVITVIQSEYE